MQVRTFQAFCLVALATWAGSCGGGGGSSSGPGGVSPFAELRTTLFDFTPTDVDAGTQISVSDSVINEGGDFVQFTRVGIYLSADTTIGDPGDYLIGVRQIANLFPGSSSSGGGTLTVPVNLPAGDYYLAAVVDDVGQVYEQNEQDNTLMGTELLTVHIAPLPDLGVGSFTFAPTSVQAGTAMSATDSVTNAGGAAASEFQVGVYLSPDATITTDDLLLGLRTVSALGVGQTSSETMPLDVPASVAAGTYSIGVIADNGGSIAEIAEGNNVLVSPQLLTVTAAPRPDLVVASISFSPPSADTGTVITVNETVMNQGTVATGAFEVGIYLSPDAEISAGDILLGVRDVASLAPSATSAGVDSVTIPIETPAGDYYVGALADRGGSELELDETNNALAAPVPLTVSVPPRPDLVPQSIAFSPNTINVNLQEMLSISDQVLNAGSVPAGTFRVGYYISINSTISTADIRIGTRDVSALGVGATSAGSSSLLLPSGINPGTYYVAVIADDTDALLELVETNNIAIATGTLDVVSTPLPQSDLIVESVSFSPLLVQPGELVQVQETVRNVGTLSSGPFHVGLYLSTDDVIGTDDIQIGQRTIANLGIGGGSASSAPYTVPQTIAAGAYFVGAIADFDGLVSEASEDNNALRASGTLTVDIPPPPGPDLTITSLAFTPSGTSVGGSVSFQIVVRNQGVLSSAPFRVGFYASSDAGVDTQDILLGTLALSDLGSNQDFSGNATFTLPAAVVAGTWHLGGIADDDGLIAEQDESNNTFVVPSTLTVQ
jgi:large repetitive protein